MTQVAPNGPLKPSFLLNGSGEPKIEILKGAYRGEPHILKRFQDTFHRGEETLRRTFKNARWVFQPDGKFTFEPTQATNLRQDLFPIFGTYLKVGRVFEIQGKRQSPSGTSTSIDGIIRIKSTEFIVDVIIIYSGIGFPKIARILQTLSETPLADKPKVEVKGVLIPSIFRISLTGKTDGQFFGPLYGYLKLLPRYPEDPNPFLVSLGTDLIDVGSINWDSYLLLQLGEGKLNAKVEVEADQIKVNVESEEKMRVGLGWFTLSQDKFFPDLPSGVTVKSGILAFTTHNTQIVGEIYATGVSDVNQISEYEVQFIGQEEMKNSFLVDYTPVNDTQVTENASDFSNYIIEGIQIPSVFEITLQGKTGEQPFGPLPGTLMIMPSAPQDPNPFSVTLTMDTQTIVNGWITWNSFIPLKDHYCDIYVKKEQIHLEIRSDENYIWPLNWYTVLQNG
jgi:hypothetical protein